MLLGSSIEDKAVQDLNARLGIAERSDGKPQVGLGTSLKDILSVCEKYLVKNPNVVADDIVLYRLTGRKKRLRVEPKLVL